MTIPRWPNELPCPVRTGAALSIGDGRKFTQADKGVLRARSQASLMADRHAAAFVLTANQAARFRRFHEEETNFGALTFIMADPFWNGHKLTDENDEWITDETGEVITIVSDWLCLFEKDSLQYSQVGVKMRVEFGVMVMP